MSSPHSFPCPQCGLSYSLTSEYLAQYGGGTTICTSCGQKFLLPNVADEPAPAEDGPAPLQPSHGVHSDGAVLVIASGGKLPHRCVRCNQPTDQFAHVDLVWSPESIVDGAAGAAYRSITAQHNQQQPTVDEPTDGSLPVGKGDSIPSSIILSYQSQKVPTTLLPGAFADEGLLVLTSEAGAFADDEVNELPKRCVRCNGLGDDAIWLCEKHAGSYRRIAWVGSCIFAAGVLTLALGFPLAVFLGICTNESRGFRALAQIATALFLLVLGPAVMGIGKISASRIDRQTAWISGCGKPFLDSLPPLAQAAQVPTERRER